MTGNARVCFHATVSAILSAGLVLLSGCGCRPDEPPIIPDDGFTELDTDITSDTTLSAGTYELTGAISIDADLTLLPGTFIRCLPGSSLTISSGGSLNAVGTAGSPIIFAGTTLTPGSWGGIRFLDSGSGDNRLEFVTIQYGGASGSGGLVLSSTGGTSGVVIANCILEQSAGYGLFVFGDADLSGFASNTLTRNAQGPCSLPPNTVQYLDAESSYSGNDQDNIVVVGGDVTDPQIWRDLGVPYLATNIQVVGEMTLSPGLTIAFNSGGLMNVQSTGSLRAVGAPGREITLTGATQTPGFWQGLSYTNTIAPGNNLTLVTIEYGGAGGGGNLNLSTAPVAVQTSSCTFAHSANCGVFIASGGTFSSDPAAPNTFVDNPGGDVCP